MSMNTTDQETKAKRPVDLEEKGAVQSVGCRPPIQLSDMYRLSERQPGQSFMTRPRDLGIRRPAAQAPDMQ